LAPLPNDPQPATTIDLGLGSSTDGVGLGSWITGELGRLLLSPHNSRKIWIKKLGDRYKFPAINETYRHVADAFIWQGKYNDAFRLTVVYEDQTPKHLTLKSALNTDFKIGFGCVQKEEENDPFGYWSEYGQLTKGGGTPMRPKKEPDVEGRLILHVGSSSCPPVKGG
ncbi:MAG: hypothetical protein GY769_06730, partial [bacterium]|nr:hypothetical protein [bacterium]